MKANSKCHETTRKQALPSLVYIGPISIGFCGVKYLAGMRSYAGANWVDADAFFPWFAIREASRYIQLFSFPPGNMVIQAENIAFLDISGRKQTLQKEWGADRARPQPAPRPAAGWFKKLCLVTFASTRQHTLTSKDNILKNSWG